MALLHSFEKSGNFLFRWRGQFPLVLVLFAIPVIYTTNIDAIPYVFKAAFTIIGISLSVLGFIVRAITIGTTPKGTSGRNTTGQVAEVLNTAGIYSVVRHPLYLGNYLMWIGIVIFTYNIYFVIIASLAYWLYYERIMFAEERYLEKKFGVIYTNWSMNVPAFLPDLRMYLKGTVPFSIKSVLRREYSGVLATVLCYTLIDHFRFYVEWLDYDLDKTSLKVLVVTVILVFILRSLKHYTKLLDEADRS
jgi:protein-S-isoprenylcysteine O-methyltransferase Ste14